MKEKQALEVAAIKMHKPCPKLRPVFSNDSQKFITSWIDLKFLPHKEDIMRGVFPKFHQIWTVHAKVIALCR